ncbi:MULTISPECIES: glucuronate isomerase [Chryseobacterium]|uniref:Uronate isomerase n=1 Tax=Chryseobacterium camelliae TaxID=1265445 RepID=A0ABU0TG64_9FLAO|nr:MULTISPECIES: glucuronate isomerase [Chryseobacterium]MDT3406136.1 glucuronate isomerase [Pseudacidovorax intermedius]MDQ1096060.1 glucuronate isomerase [Chryseobacterium camelliae]MDQ1099997.1 glucuronate isomerase [Chryseobacterium sp. SORGH_AS_1048]MDR6087342.1 glucuronate isomerase [Chryseobacterium sp. SORGH_AS_0909]MDR6131717.1 glucuronate isomerase [Chryseobacterium sp. SORGH_AS_1175]
MSNFINHKEVFGESFLLESAKAENLYFGYAKDLPVIDYHNHLEPDVIAKNQNFRSPAAIWLDGDHYKWRAMRNFGVQEKFISGSASDEEKFQQWAEVVPYTLRNPLFHWTHLELKNPFGITEYLSGKNSDAVYSKMNDALQSDPFRPQQLLQHFNVETLCTTDDPSDSLEFHQAIKESDFTIGVFPAFRPDAYIAFTDGRAYRNNLQKLEIASGISIRSASDLLEALQLRINYFHAHGARISDHGFEFFPDTEKWNDTLDKEFREFLSGDRKTFSDPGALSGYLLKELCRMYAAKGWVQQFHVGATRNNNSKMLNKIGVNAGYDAIGESYFAQRMSIMFDELNASDQLAKTIIYTLNPTLNEVLATMAGNFNEEGIKGKVQFGAAWWFLDQLDGMEKQMNAVSNLGLISTFIGMLTDSRSFLSFSRHEYFRRLLCNMFGSEMERGLLPNDEEWVGKIIRDICYYNTKNYFGF